ncbi:FG-GAP repeat domain-containing protein [Loktanella sp. DJP18]|uniref:FG-GAP repeat domain-containing protein n=1 Tax=Loktanella sp. DJP18 TaxID=3409788 RepID=UPI003BB6616D
MRAWVVAGLLTGLATHAAACANPPPALVGAIAVSAGPTVSRAWYARPTTIYDHAILGRTTTAEILRLETTPMDADRCLTWTIAAGEGHVFEDTVPHIADLDDDGIGEVIAVRTSLTQGAQLAIYGLRGAAWTLLATTPYIGEPRRWLATIGVGDLDGDGRVEIAYIDRPHLVRQLRVWRFDGTELTEAYRVDGLTNHRIGDPAISGGLRTCGGVPEAVTATADWSRIVATRIVDGTAQMRDLGPNTGPAAFAAALTCP